MNSIPEIARRWIGTPFRKGAAILGAGVDCVHLALEIYREAGLPITDTFGDYSLDGGRHLETSKVVSWLKESPHFKRVECDEPGDLILFRIGGVEHHVGVGVSGSTFVHAIKKHGVIESNLADSTWTKRRSLVYRPIFP